MSTTLVLYCQKSWLDIEISRKFFFDNHYCWVTTSFDKKGNPTSSNPKKRYEILKNDVETSDHDSYMIKQNKAGIKAGAGILKSKGVITTQDELDIIDCVDGSSLLQFKPCILIIPFELVKAELISVKPKSKANPLSDEYIIEKLTRDKFDIIEF